MKILVINSGSSSIKYRIIDTESNNTLTCGSIEDIGAAESRLTQSWHDKQNTPQQVTHCEILTDHRAAIKRMSASLQEDAVRHLVTDLAGVGHRVVHGGSRFQTPTLLSADVITAITDISTLAPLHIPANVAGIKACLVLYPNLPQVAVFDTAFHHSLPSHAYRYAIPETWYQRYHVRRYGFHGTSHAYVTRRVADYLKQPAKNLNIISLHLGNGASVAAIRSGLCIDTSMGFTPMEGLIMGTRCGDLDPSILLYIHQQTGADLQQIISQLNQQSGLKGLCGENDMRIIQQRASSGDADALLAIEMYSYRIKKYIGAYFAALGRLDALVFTAGIGENSSMIRARVCEGLNHLGIKIDPDKNSTHSGSIRELQAHDAHDACVKILVIPTNEELEIARQTAACIKTQ